MDFGLAKSFLSMFYTWGRGWQHCKTAIESVQFHSTDLDFEFWILDFSFGFAKSFVSVFFAANTWHGGWQQCKAAIELIQHHNIDLDLRFCRGVIHCLT